ncbi:beta-lactamase-like protein [Aspergillus pseudoustus]|uniref:Beta-lactamase-like protein n=1 Tax=Aspergillus pseudoustus TaxID=1810923 RepID=A0ABR4JAC8_9EURO
MPPILQADVYVSSRLPLAIKRAGEPSLFSPISCTLIHGSTDAALVDTPISISQTEDLAAWIKATAPRKSLRYVYITHGHGDHCFGIPTLRAHWPDLVVVATAGTVAHMREQLGPAILEGTWLTLFPNGQIAAVDDLQRELSLVQTLTGSPKPVSFTLEDHKLHAIEVGHTDTHDTTVLHVPSLRLVVAGDAVYGDVHQYFGEANTPAKRAEWLRALDTIEALDAQTVVAGHKRAGTVDGLFNLRKTRQYILDFEDAVAKTKDWKELAGEMQRIYPNRINPHAILRGAAAAFPEGGVVGAKV